MYILILCSDIEASANPKGFSYLNEVQVKNSLFESMMEVKEEEALRFRSEWEKDSTNGLIVFQSYL